MLAVPIVLFGKFKPLATQVIEEMKPEYDVVHVVMSRSDGEREMPTLLQGEAKKPVSGLGSNAHNASIATSGRHPVPRAVVVGGLFSQEDFDAMRALPGADQVAWLRASAEEVAQNKDTPPPAKRIAERVKKSLHEHGLVPGVDDSKELTGVWDY